MSGLPEWTDAPQRDPAATSGILVVIALVALVFGIVFDSVLIYVAFSFALGSTLFLILAVRNRKPPVEEPEHDLEDMLSDGHPQPEPPVPVFLPHPRYPLPDTPHTYTPLPAVPEPEPPAPEPVPEPDTVPMKIMALPPVPTLGPGPLRVGRTVRAEVRTRQYHRADCGILGEHSTELTQTEAIRSGYMACTHCRP